MKVFCRYSLVDTHSGKLLAFGEKWKCVDKLNADYINDGTQGFFRKHTMYHRNLEVCGKRCVILLFALHFRRRGERFNAITESGYNFHLNGQLVNVDKKVNSYNYAFALKAHGIVGVGCHS